MNACAWVTAVTEDLYDPHNISAVLRSCDGFGLQSAHIIEVNNPYRVSPGVAKGAAKWLDIERHQDTTQALRDLKSRGFAICCTTPHTNDTTPEDLPIDRPVALVFGSEGPGITEAARAEADYFVRIPMFGFTESYNISVAAALTLQTVTRRVRSATQIALARAQREHPRILGDWAEQNRQRRRWPAASACAMVRTTTLMAAQNRSPRPHERNPVDQLQSDTKVGTPGFCGHVHAVSGGPHRQLFPEPSLRRRPQWRRQCGHLCTSPWPWSGKACPACGQILIARRVGEGRTERALVLLRTGLLGMS